MVENKSEDNSEDKKAAMAKNVNESRAPLEVAPVGLPKSLRWTFAGGGILLVALLLISYLHPYMPERVKFFTGNALSLLLLVVIVAQAIIYRRQWAVMEKQSQAMQESLVEMRKLYAVGEYQGKVAALGVRVSERNAIAAEASANAAGQAVEITRENMIYAQRAYVMFESATVEYRDDTHLAVGFSIKNFGNTPALNFRPFTRIELRTTEPEINEEGVEWEGPGGIIPPHYSRQTIRNLTITLDERKQMGPGKPLRLHLWGMVKYNDIFGKEHLTKFCTVHNIGTGPRFGECETGNEAT